MKTTPEKACEHCGGTGSVWHAGVPGVTNPRPMGCGCCSLVGVPSRELRALRAIRAAAQRVVEAYPRREAWHLVEALDEVRAALAAYPEGAA